MFVQLYFIAGEVFLKTKILLTFLRKHETLCRAFSIVAIPSRLRVLIVGTIVLQTNRDIEINVV